MPTIFRNCLFAAFSLFLLGRTYPASASEVEVPVREYPFSIGVTTDSRNAVRAGIAINKLGYDFYREGIQLYLPEWIEPWVEPVWSVFWTFNMTMWPHDFGHWARANQAGGNFVIERYAFPFPLARMDVPDDATPLDVTLMSGGGFEINTLMRQYTENRYYQTGSRDAEDLIHSFIQSMMFPIYTILIAPTDPDKPDTWGETYGDPVDYTKQVYLNYTGRPVLTADNKVDPTLSRLYREIFWVNLLTMTVDPWLYKNAKVFTLDMKRRPRMSDPWLYQNDSLAWAYTTQFNTGALGYEVYLTQHLKSDDHYFSLYVREGRPFKNHGAGIQAPEILRDGRFSLGAKLEAWDQDLFGIGGMATLTTSYRIYSRIELSTDVHWKDDGYAVGHRTERGAGWLLNTTFFW